MFNHNPFASDEHVPSSNSNSNQQSQSNKQQFVFTGMPPQKPLVNYSDPFASAPSSLDQQQQQPQQN